MELDHKPRSRKKQMTAAKAGVIAAGAVAVAAAVSLGVYVNMGRKYTAVFFPNTTINGIDASEKTPEEVKALISSGIDGYELTLVKRGGEKEIIKKDDIGLHSVFDGTLESMLEAQKPNQWLKYKMNKSDHEVDTMIAYDEDEFQKTAAALECFDETKVTVPKDAYLSEYEPGQGYRIIPEEQGNKLDKDLVIQAISDAALSLEPELSLEELGSYQLPEVTKEDAGLTELAAQLNRYTGVTVTYQFGDNKEVLSGDTINQWLTVTADSQVSVSSNAAAAFVKTLADKYNTYNRAKNLKTSYGPTVRITGGIYGWKLNQSAEVQELLAIIKSGESQTREPVYSQKAGSHGTNDYGDTYVELNLTAQHLYFYKDGKLLVESDFVSGNLAKGYGTPAGSYPLNYKERNATLKGEDYRTPVSYWMPFNGNIGLHDANWRTSFGGNYYKTSGSHGCVNLPPAVAQKIYENIEPGMPILCYNLEGTEKTGTTSVPKETQASETTKVPETTKAPDTTKPETTKAPETTAATEVIPEESSSAPAKTPGSGQPGPGSGTAGTEASGAAGPGA